MDNTTRTICIDPTSSFAALTFLSLMCWPKQKGMNAALATFGAEAKGAAKLYAENAEALAHGNVPPVIAARLAAAGITNWKLPEVTVASPGIAAQLADGALMLGHEAKTQLFDPAGGDLTVAAAPGLEAIIAQVTQAIDEGGVASGLILIVIARLQAYLDQNSAEYDGKNRVFTASFARASTVVGQLHCGKEHAFGGERSHKKYHAAWKAAEPLWAAAMMSGGYPWDQKDMRLPKEALLHGLFNALENPGALERTLAYAHWFQDFALGHKAPGASGPLLRPQETLPVAFTIPPKRPPFQFPNDAELAIAEDHRAYVIKNEPKERKR